MKTFTLGFIGSGNMNSAILNGVLKQGIALPEQVWISDCNQEKLEAFQARGVHTTLENRKVVEEADLIILGIKPQMFVNAMPDIIGHTTGKCIVSIAPGHTVASIKAQLPDTHVIRVMPNTPLMVGVGATAVAEAPEVPDELFQTVLSLFAAAGEVAVIQESQMDDIINVNGSSPAWFFRMAEVMVSRAVSVGFAEDTALRLVAKTMEGAAKMMQESGKTPAELRVQVCSPGGTTLASLTAFDEMGFEALMLEAMDRCTKRSVELGQS